MFLNSLFGYEARRKRLLKKVPSGALHDFLSVPFPSEATSLSELPILSVDFETTGLNAMSDKLLSVGFVSIDKRQIKLGSCYHQIINTEHRLDADNVIIHHITDQQKSQGKSLQVVVEALLKALAGKVMLVHFARIEKQFLRQACLELYGVSPPLMILDTLAMAKRKLDRSDISYDPQELRLSALRHKHNLPNHFAHNALSDAIATAELLLVQQKTGATKLKDLL
ncbi:exonuclease domain-containing protein [Paraglaciecola psychrophila]|uniref:Exonuclase n=1 Tax=Paraglaciecola psychrophila 170 TaxID=1129794 RepID=K6YZH9_9ALTE|nr:exonuclease domain-containing protein [Paraglaciecola psychrophila]AGH45511.1 exonuclase [Paraglaciecola psychrophila 170]GAC38174.1 DNA polymerase III subunit epsilon [Paraglaciecola psychrophila 170]